jgi:hypothetical protein
MLSKPCSLAGRKGAALWAAIEIRLSAWSAVEPPKPCRIFGRHHYTVIGN